ncbi:hypothetical protein TM239_31090 [Bradyrhizobium sp. TM239]|nr:hypothetical protein TM239_31090 [Bradyrhizobium sp. TM239]
MPRTLRSVSSAMRSIVRFDGALQSRGPCISKVRGFLVSALRRNADALQLVRDMKAARAATGLPNPPCISSQIATRACKKS